MTKSQFNIKISKDLLIRVKRQARFSGKSLTEHITDLLSKSLSENEIGSPDFDHTNRISCIEKRLLSLESIVFNREYLSEKLKPFNNHEAENCTKFMRGVFEMELQKRNVDDKKKAFEDLLRAIKVYDDLSNSLLDRLQEVMLSDNPNPWTGKELNEISGGNKCNCSIRKGLINWTGKIVFPSQQEICDSGEKLLSLL